MRIMQHLWSSLLRSEIKKIISSHLRLRARVFLLDAVLLPFLFSPGGRALAGSATWNLNPISNEWNTAANWTPPTVPNGPGDIATFALSNTTSISVTSISSIDVNEIVFDGGASPFTLTVPSSHYLFIFVGITNDSGITQNFVAPQFGSVRFLASATAGSLTTFTNMGDQLGGFFGGFTDFFDTSSAASGTFINEAGTVTDGFGGETTFNGAATAGNGNFVNRGATLSDAGAGGFTDFFGDASNASRGTFTSEAGVVSGAPGGATRFFSTSSAGDATITAHGGALSGVGPGNTFFLDSSTASHAVLIADGGLNGARGGVIFFFGTSDGAASGVQLLDRGRLDISLHSLPGMAVGSIEGNGTVFLGANNLSVGGNNENTSFSGVILDGGTGGGTGGSTTKVGTGRLTLFGASTYTGGSIVEGGKLVVNNMSGSGTGTGSVQVNAGTLGGTGSIAGAVTVGTGSGARARLAPARPQGQQGKTLTIQSTLTFKSDATYEIGLDSVHAVADEVVAAGVTIDSGAHFSVLRSRHSVLTLGTVFTVIDNTSGTPIAGTFANLADGSTFTVNGNTFQASYEGGDGNDLTLTVVP